MIIPNAQSPIDSDNSSSSDSLAFPLTDQYPLNVLPSVFDGVAFTFLIGSTSTPPLISYRSILAHLRLLSAFHTLENSISRPPADPFQPPGFVRWRVFIHQAVWRFEIWLKRVVKPRGITGGSLKYEEIPPLDVILVWHSYLLNPCAYTDDTQHAHPELASLGGLPLERIAGQINPVTSQFEPTPAQITFWQLTTLTPHSPLALSPSKRDELTIQCPRCSFAPLPVAWLCEPHEDEDGYAHGKGWCQNEFDVWCKNCRFSVTRESIVVGRFAAAIARAMVDQHFILPGTLFDPTTSTPALAPAHTLTTLLLQPLVDLSPTQPAIGDHLGWSFAGILRCVAEAREILLVSARNRSGGRAVGAGQGAGLPRRAGRGELRARIVLAQAEVGEDVEGKWRVFGPRIAKMLAAYQDNPAPFSIDLVSAVLHHTTFTSQLASLSWLSPSPSLPAIIPRYHAFLHLLSLTPTLLPAPTLDIDLAWHTHQLLASTYMSDVRRCVGRYVEHEARVERGVLLAAFARMAGVWERAFGGGYTEVGMGVERFGTRAARPLGRIMKLVAAAGASEHEVPGPVSSDAGSGTCLSEHASVVIVPDERNAHERSKRSRRTGSGSSPIDELSSGVTFGALGRRRWALLGSVDHGKTVTKGQCCAGYGMPYYSGPVWGGECCHGDGAGWGGNFGGGGRA